MLLWVLKEGIFRHDGPVTLFLLRTWICAQRVLTRDACQVNLTFSCNIIMIVMIVNIIQQPCSVFLTSILSFAVGRELFVVMNLFIWFDLIPAIAQVTDISFLLLPFSLSSLLLCLFLFLLFSPFVSISPSVDAKTGPGTMSVFCPIMVAVLAVGRTFCFRISLGSCYWIITHYSHSHRGSWAWRKDFICVVPLDKKTLNNNSLCIIWRPAISLLARPLLERCFA